MENTTAWNWAADLDCLSDLIVTSEDMQAFLDGLACLAANAVSRAAGMRVECAVTLDRRKRPRTIGGSTDTAIDLKRLEQAPGEWPCIDAVAGGGPFSSHDVLTSPHWGQCCGALSAAGDRSLLGLPLALAEDGAAAMTFLAGPPGWFSSAVVAEAVSFSVLASKAVRVALRIRRLNELTEDLDAAMTTRSVINIACGVIIAQNGCTQDEAIAILRKASSDRNQKLRDLARDLVNGVSRHQTSAVSGGAFRSGPQGPTR
ncbi:ANTAR domain-containing protein [Paenarthrobacter sp. NPDC092416]|uniref:ANTAR domain-containing protein n=1 Tax=Paenarthrobacter sp. NPDC092416 TaxID=3364386 RepID=UPI00380984C5